MKGLDEMKKIRLLSLALALCMAVSILVVPASAAQFSDVPSNHWAAEYIKEVTDGGLMSGYGNGKFGPEDKFTVAQMATVVCRAAGYTTGKRGTNWAHDALYYCVHEMKCLPIRMNLFSSNYFDPCTREIAYYMLVTGLVGDDAKPVRKVSPADIPDYDAITKEYRDVILKAYQYGLTTGVNSSGEFNPKGELTRAQAAAMYARAGFVKAADTPAKTDPNSSLALFDKLYELGEFEKSKYDASMRTTARKYGSFEVELNGAYIELFIRERGSNSQTFSKSGDFVDVNGKVVPSPYDENGVYRCATGYGYESRTLIKKILMVCFGENYQEAYDAVKECFLNESHELRKNPWPSAVRLIGDDNRLFEAYFVDSAINAFAINIGPKDAQELYEYYRETDPTASKYSWVSYDYSTHPPVKAFELDRW